MRTLGEQPFPAGEIKIVFVTIQIETEWSASSRALLR